MEERCCYFIYNAQKKVHLKLKQKIPYLPSCVLESYCYATFVDRFATLAVTECIVHTF